MNEPILDEYCKKIVSVLTLIDQDYRFNALCKFLNDHGIKISKPTLSEHLKHLTKQRIVLRKQKGIQEVSYTMNFERFKKLSAASGITKDVVTRFFQQEREYRRLPIGKKIDRYHVLTVLQSLMLLKLEILAISKPENQFEYSLAHYVTIQHFMTIQNWLLDELRKNPSELEQATQELQDLTDRYMKIVFKTKPSDRKSVV